MSTRNSQKRRAKLPAFLLVENQDGDHTSEALFSIGISAVKKKLHSKHESMRVIQPLLTIN